VVKNVLAAANMRWLIALVIALGVFVSGSVAPGEPGPLGRGREPRVLGSGCTAEATKSLVRSFAADYNSGRVPVINGFWAPAPRFLWFSTGPPGARLGPRAYNRATLAAYFRARVRVHERIHLTDLRAGYDPTRKIVNFGGKLVRTADDRPPPRAPQDFKGAADCLSGHPLLIVWSM
jgi:hypothetical protein